MHSSLSKKEMSVRLEKSWKFLSGTHLSFGELKSELPAPDHHYMTVVIPIGSVKESSTSAIAVGLLINKLQAAKAASFMFDIDQDKLSAPDISDACKEACNVLGGCLSFDDENQLGIPTEISPEKFMELQNTSPYKFTFSSEKPYEGQVVLTILFLSKNHILNGI